MIFVLKIVLVPALIGMISFAVRRWGTVAVSLLAGIPVVAGPILFILAIEQGPHYAAGSAVAAMTAVLANVSFALAYSFSAAYCKPLPSLGIGFLGFGLAAGVLQIVDLSLYPALCVTLLGLWLALKAFPENLNVKPLTQPPLTQPSLTQPMKRDLFIRMFIGAALVVMVTGLAEITGPYVSGILSLFPAISSVLAYFTHKAAGAGAAVGLLKAIAGGFYAFVAFCFATAWLLPRIGIGMSFFLALGVGILIHLSIAMYTHHWSPGKTLLARLK